jgi:hypothetical protein
MRTEAPGNTKGTRQQRKLEGQAGQSQHQVFIGFKAGGPLPSTSPHEGGTRDCAHEDRHSGYVTG